MGWVDLEHISGREMMQLKIYQAVMRAQKEDEKQITTPKAFHSMKKSKAEAEVESDSDSLGIQNSAGRSDQGDVGHTNELNLVNAQR